MPFFPVSWRKIKKVKELQTVKKGEECDREETREEKTLMMKLMAMKVRPIGKGFVIHEN